MEQNDLTVLNVAGRDFKHQDNYICSNGRRNIYCCVPYLSHEQEALALLTNESDLKQEQLLRLVYSANFDPQLARENIKIYETYQQVPFCKEIEEILLSGLMYLSSRDQISRPIIVIDLKVFRNNSHWSHEIVFKALIFFLNYVKNNALQDYFVEQWSIILLIEDLEETLQIIGDALENYLRILSIVFCGHLYKIIFMNCTIRPVINALVQQFGIRQRAVFFESFDSVHQLIPASCLEKRFNGQLEDVSRYWPPFSHLLKFTMKQSINSNWRHDASHEKHTIGSKHNKVQSALSFMENSSKNNSILKICVLQEDGNQIMEEEIEIPEPDESLVEVPNLDQLALSPPSGESENYDHLFEEEEQKRVDESKEKNEMKCSISQNVCSPKSNILESKTMPTLMKTSKSIKKDSRKDIQIQMEGEQKPPQGPGCCSGSCLIF